MTDLISVQLVLPVLVLLVSLPGLIAISSPTFRQPFRMVPPATPPLKVSASWPRRAARRLLPQSWLLLGED